MGDFLAIPSWTARFPRILVAVYIFAGGWISLFATEVRSSFPFYIGEGEFNIYATIAWVLFALTAFLYYRRQEALTNREKRTHQEFENLFRTMPPAAFLATFREHYRICVPLIGEAGTEESVRFVLRSISLLAQLFDRSPEGAQYAANVMLYFPMDNVNESDLASWDIKFMAKDQDPKTLRGVIVLKACYSTTASDESASPDSNVTLPDDKSFALPVPKTTYDSIAGQPRPKFLPGAPKVMVTLLDGDEATNAQSGYQDASKLANWCETKGSFDPGVIEEVREYFAESESIHLRSFVSFPLELSSGVAIGVVNVHCNQPNRVGTEGALTHLGPLMAPFLNLVAGLVADCENPS